MNTSQKLQNMALMNNKQWLYGPILIIDRPINNASYFRLYEWYIQQTWVSFAGTWGSILLWALSSFAQLFPLNNPSWQVVKVRTYQTDQALHFHPAYRQCNQHCQALSKNTTAWLTCLLFLGRYILGRCSASLSQYLISTIVLRKQDWESLQLSPDPEEIINES